MKLKLRLNIKTKLQNLKKKQILIILNYTLCDIQLQKFFLMSLPLMLLTVFHFSNSKCNHFGRFYNRSKMCEKRSENDKRTI